MCIRDRDTEGRVDALAHIISGDHATELSRANAREMRQCVHSDLGIQRVDLGIRCV